MRPRQSNPHNLPPGMHIKHGAFYLVKGGAWTWLERVENRVVAFEKYAKLTGPQKLGGMVALIERVFKLVSTTPSAKTGDYLAAETIKSYDQARKRLVDVFSDFEPQQVKGRHVAAMRNKDAGQPGKARRNQIFLKIVMDVALEEELIEFNPVVGVRKTKTNARTRYITDDEFIRIYRAAGPRLRVIMKLCYLTGQRIGNVLKIRFEQLAEAGIEFQKHKTSKPLTVKWSPHLAIAIDEARALLTSGKVSLIQKGPLLRGERAHKRHKAPAYSTINDQWLRACEKAEPPVEGATLHDLRAKSATDAEKQGFDPQALLDHADGATTRKHYLRDPDVPLVTGPSFRQKIDN